MRAAVLVALLSLGLVLGGLALARHDRRGEPATATVLGCQTRYKLPPLCRGQWTAGGSLLAGGRVVRGTIEGANRGDVGTEVAVRVAGDSAWMPSNRLPVVLIGAGIAVALTGAGVAIGRRARAGSSRSAQTH